VVLEVDRHPIANVPELKNAIRGYRPGDTLSVRVRRENQELSYSVTLTHPVWDLSRVAFQNQMGGKLSFRRDDFTSVYQHDAVISPDECGGPVVNLEGKAVGINIARAGRTETYALSSDVILGVLEDMKSGVYPPPLGPGEERRPIPPALPEAAAR
jgi:serine protease Do